MKIPVIGTIDAATGNVSMHPEMYAHKPSHFFYKGDKYESWPDGRQFRIDRKGGDIVRHPLSQPITISQIRAAIAANEEENQ